MNRNSEVLRQDLIRQLDRITRICLRWGIPEICMHRTRLLRGPCDDAVALFLTDERDLADASRGGPS